MDRRLKLAIVLFFILLIVFITVIYTSEIKNMETLRTEYPELEMQVYTYREDNLKAWAINMFLKFLIPFLFLVTGFSQRISVLVGKDRGWFLSGLLYGIVLFTIMGFSSEVKV